MIRQLYSEWFLAIWFLVIWFLVIWFLVIWFFRNFYGQMQFNSFSD